MNEKELLKLVAPMWKQYLRCIVGCFCAFLTLSPYLHMKGKNYNYLLVI